MTTSASRLEPDIRLLVADGDPAARSRLVSGARSSVGEIVVLEAGDGAEAIQLGLQHRPAIALFDVDLPRLGGIEAATTLCQLRPQMRLALYAANPRVHREPGPAHELPLFDKRDLNRALTWVRAQIAWFTAAHLSADPAGKLDFSCTSCGYGIWRSTPPHRCPMCQAENAWMPSAPQASTAVVVRA
jgi:CheY-like chemotaxis protein